MHIQDGATPLYIASQNGHDKVVQLLTQAGASLDLEGNVSCACVELRVCVSGIVCRRVCGLQTLHHKILYKVKAPQHLALHDQQIISCHILLHAQIAVNGCRASKCKNVSRSTW